jgi:hypothetical protein
LTVATMAMTPKPRRMMIERAPLNSTPNHTNNQK